MEKTISAAEANRKFSALLRGVREGHSYLVTSHGKPVARIVPSDGMDAAELRRRERARRELLDHLRTRKPLHVPWTRADAYDEGGG